MKQIDTTWKTTDLEMLQKELDNFPGLSKVVYQERLHSLVLSANQFEEYGWVWRSLGRDPWKWFWTKEKFVPFDAQGLIDAILEKQRATKRAAILKGIETKRVRKAEREARGKAEQDAVEKALEEQEQRLALRRRQARILKRVTSSLLGQ